MTAAASARVLLDRGDANGATSRAYYAMFNAARALLWLKEGAEPEAVKKHASVIRRFSERFVKTGSLPADTVQLLIKAGEARFIADYDEIDVELISAKQHIKAMDQFLDAVAALKEQ